MPSESKSREGASVASCEPFGKEGILITIPAIISETGSQAKSGKLTILISGLEIHDSNSLLLHQFAREDIDDIKVHSPYEISIRQRFIGKPDVAYRVISAKMPKAIPVLEVQFSKRIELLEDTSELRSTGVSLPTEKSCSVWHTDVTADLSFSLHLLGCAGRHEPAVGGQEGAPLELQRSAPFLSEEEAEELSEVLRKLKGLALDAEAELEWQDEALDGITAAVDRATLTVDKHNRRIRKLT